MAKRAPARTRSRRTTATVRERILTEATALFLERGFAGASMNALSARVGGSKTTLYAQFGNKEALFAAVVDHVLRETNIAFDEIDYDTTEFAPGLNAIARLFLQTVTAQQSIDICRLAYFEARRSPRIGQLYIDHGPVVGFAGVERFFRRHMALGGAPCTDAGKAADYFLGMLLHKVMLWRYCGVRKRLTRREIEAHATTVAQDFLAVCDRF